VKIIIPGGASAPWLTEQHLDITLDYEGVAAAGSMLGSGAVIVLDETTSAVETAYKMDEFFKHESCGKCTPCREGTKRMLEILDRITAGQGVEDDLVNLERLGKLLRKASLCGLGRAAPNPVLSTLKHFRDEYEAHIREKRCPAGKCKFERKDQPVMPYRPGMQEPLTQRIVEVMR